MMADYDGIMNLSPDDFETDNEWMDYVEWLVSYQDYLEEF